jgi:agmatine deiminase
MPLLDARKDVVSPSHFEAGASRSPDGVGVPAREILLGGGNIHCITQRIPSGVVHEIRL